MIDEKEYGEIKNLPNDELLSLFRNSITIASIFELNSSIISSVLTKVGLIENIDLVLKRKIVQDRITIEEFAKRLNLNTPVDVIEEIIEEVENV